MHSAVTSWGADSLFYNHGGNCIWVGIYSLGGKGVRADHELLQKQTNLILSVWEISPVTNVLIEEVFQRAVLAVSPHPRGSGSLVNGWSSNSLERVLTTGSGPQWKVHSLLMLLLYKWNPLFIGTNLGGFPLTTLMKSCWEAAVSSLIQSPNPCSPAPRLSILKFGLPIKKNLPPQSVCWGTTVTLV